MIKINCNSFNPFKTNLNQDKTVKILESALHGADDGELFFERRKSESFLLQDNKLKNSNYSSSQGFGLRVVKEEKTGYAHSNEISETSIRRAAETSIRAAKGKGGKSDLAPSPVKTDKILYSNNNPINEFSFSYKVDLLQEINSFARKLDNRVAQVSINLASSIQEISILRLDTPLLNDSRPMIRLSVSVIVDQSGRRETGSSGSGGRENLATLTDSSHWKPLVKEALRIALVNLDSSPAPAGVMDVVLGPGWPGILLHEAIGHGLEGDFNRKKTSAFCKLMGQKIAASGVTILDDGTIPNRRGSLSIDDEGTPSGKNTLIEDGVLVGYMQDRQNARLMNSLPTGNGRRESYAHSPLPRMTNTYMLAGKDSPSDILAELRNGIYAVGFGGGQVDITNGKFVFSCTEAYKVENGKILHPVQGATIIGDGATALKNIRAIGDDLKLDPGVGNCGKAGQWVPVGVGQPTLMIGGLTVGGAKI